jgi:hypothetical protein
MQGVIIRSGGLPPSALKSFQHTAQLWIAAALDRHGLSGLGCLGFACERVCAQLLPLLACRRAGGRGELPSSFRLLWPGIGMRGGIPARQPMRTSAGCCCRMQAPSGSDRYGAHTSESWRPPASAPETRPAQAHARLTANPATCKHAYGGMHCTHLLKFRAPALR